MVRVIDFETTGLPPDAVVCEVGWCDVRIYDDGDVSIGKPIGMLVDPNRPMPPEARAIHHISDNDVFGCPSIVAGFMELTKGSPHAFVAHNAKFEREFFAGGEAAWICTLKVGRRLWPDSPSHSNQCLRYFLGIDLDDQLAMPPHRAAPDAYVTAFIFSAALKAGASVKDMIEWSNQPSLLPGAINFGKHKGVLWSACDRDYLRWITSQKDMDEDKRFTAKYWLEKR